MRTTGTTHPELTIALTYMAYPGERMVRLFDEYGQLVMEELLDGVAQDYQLEFAQRPAPGVYYLRVESALQTYTGKVLIAP